MDSERLKKKGKHVSKNKLAEKEKQSVIFPGADGDGITDWHGKDLLSALLAVEQVSLPLEPCQI